MPAEFEKLIIKRRSIYNLGSEISLTQPEITELVKQAVMQCPTAFNSQSGRAVILFGQSHYKLWQMTAEALYPLTPAEQFPKTRAKLDSFAAGTGTILYFIDDNVTKGLQEKFSLYADKFPVWAEQANGMLQYIVWTLFAEHGIGASLQHYNPIIDNTIHQTFNLPENWRLIAQMPFGSIEAPAETKSFELIDERVKIIL